jgi:phenylpyruvate tautomerase
MPYLKIQTNRSIAGEAEQPLLQKASRLVAKELGKPEQYVMVRLEPASAMVFAGSAEPVAFLELRAIGLPVKKTPGLSRALCELVKAELGIPGDRVFINFADVPANLWGWNSETF